MYDLTSSNLVEVLTTTTSTTTTTWTSRSKYGDLTNRKSYKQMRIRPVGSLNHDFRQNCGCSTDKNGDVMDAPKKCDGMDYQAVEVEVALR